MSITIHPGQVGGTVPAPGSKSVTHRALLLTLLTRGGTIRNPLWSEDTLATLGALKAFGLKAVATTEEAVIRGEPPHAGDIDAANSGTTLRLTTGLAATLPGTSRLTGDASLSKRPMGPLVDALNQLGAEATCHGEDGRPPITVTGPAQGGTAKIRGDVSSQFISALLMAGPRCSDGVTVHLTSELTSRPYAELTIAMMRTAGFTVEVLDEGWHVPAQRPPAVHLEVPGDYSACAFPLVAAAITGGKVTVTNLPEASGQGDEAILNILTTFGCKLTREDDAVTLHEAELTAAEIDLGDTPDLFPPLATLAACTPGETRLHGAPHLAHKESDRIQAMTEGLSALGAKIQPTEDGAIIQGGSLSGGTVQHHHDHRIQMALAVAALVADGPVTIQGPDDVHAVSYPAFLDHLTHLGIQVDRSDQEAPA